MIDALHELWSRVPVDHERVVGFFIYAGICVTLGLLWEFRRLWRP
jgi:hypothetical protein